MLIAFVPLIGLEITLGIPTMWNIFNASITSTDCPWNLFGIPILITTVWAVAGAVESQFNPLSTVFIFATCYAVLGTMQFVGQHIGTLSNTGQTYNGGITGVDVAMWCLLFIGLDYRWYDTDYWFGAPGMMYDWWAVAITLLGLIGWGMLRNLQGFGYRLIPTLKDFGIAILSLLALASVVIPIGLWTGFLVWPPSQIPTVIDVFTLWFENVLTVAITEELFFRMVIMNGINQTWPSSRGWKGLFISSIIFGLMHWPRKSGQLIEQILYASLAFIAGLVYGNAYQLSGNNILAAVLTHSLTDTLWAFVLSG